MLPHDAIRFHLLQARKLAKARRDRVVASLMVDALVAARRDDDGVTESVMTNRFGFTAEEIASHRKAAVDRATVRWMTRTSVDTIAA